jgi:hypothetical protein
MDLTMNTIPDVVVRPTVGVNYRDINEADAMDVAYRCGSRCRYWRIWMRLVHDTMYPCLAPLGGSYEDE